MRQDPAWMPGKSVSTNKHEQARRMVWAVCAGPLVWGWVWQRPDFHAEVSAHLQAGRRRSARWRGAARRAWPSPAWGRPASWRRRARTLPCWGRASSCSRCSARQRSCASGWVSSRSAILNTSWSTSFRGKQQGSRHMTAHAWCSLVNLPPLSTDIPGGTPFAHEDHAGYQGQDGS